MIVGKFAPKAPILQNDEPGAGGGGLNIIDDDSDGAGHDGSLADDDGGDGDGGDGDGQLDRGDNVDVGAGTGDTDPDQGQQANRIPQARLNEVIAQRDAERERREALEREVAALRAGAAPSPAPSPAPTAPPAPAVPDFDEQAKEKEYAELLADGEFDKAAALRMEINAHIRQQATVQAEENIQTRAVTQSLTEVAQQAVTDFPFLDTPEGAPAMAAIMAERNRLAGTGIPLADALQQAVDKLAPKLAPDGFVAPEGRGTPGKGSTTQQRPGDTRPARAAARGALTSGAQPPALKGGQGNGSGAGVLDDVEQLTEAQFEALSPAEKARLRGD